MYHNAYARGPVPASHIDLDGGTNVCTAVLHMLEHDFGANGSEFEVDVVGDEIEVNFVSTEDTRSLRDALTSFGTDGVDENGEWTFAFDVVYVD